MAKKDGGYAMKSPRGRPHDVAWHRFDGRPGIAEE